MISEIYEKLNILMIISPFLTMSEVTKREKQTNMKIGVRSVVKAKVGELDNITREGRIRRINK